MDWFALQFFPVRSELPAVVIRETLFFLSMRPRAPRPMALFRTVSMASTAPWSKHSADDVEPDIRLVLVVGHEQLDLDVGICGRELVDGLLGTRDRRRT